MSTVKQALDSNIHIVGLSWLTGSISNKKRENEKNHSVADETEEDGKDEEKEVTPEPEPVTTGRGTKRRAATTKKEEPEEEEPEPPAKKTKKVTVGKGKAKAAKDEETVEEPEKEAKMKTIIKKGKAPVDEWSGRSSMVPVSLTFEMDADKPQTPTMSTSMAPVSFGMLVSIRHKFPLMRTSFTTFNSSRAIADSHMLLSPIGVVLVRRARTRPSTRVTISVLLSQCSRSSSGARLERPGQIVIMRAVAATSTPI